MNTEKQQGKTATVVESYKARVSTFLDDVMRKAFTLPQGWWERRDIAKNHYDLGIEHLQQGHVSDALLRFRLVTWLEPNNANAWYYLGRTQLADGKNKQAQATLQRALKLNPDNDEARYMLALAGGLADNEMPMTIPRTLVHAHFESLAMDFNQQQLEELEYKGHIFVSEAIRACAEQGRSHYAILELGIGTGLCGKELRDIAGRLVGVDMSSAMLQEAKKLRVEDAPVYDALFNREIEPFLTEQPEASYDIILACGVASYIGDIKPMMHQAARVVRSGGMIVLTADISEQGDCKLNTDLARFSFSKPYLESLAATNGMKVVRLEQISSYSDYNEWLCVFSK